MYSFLALCLVGSSAPKVTLDVHLDMVPNLVYQIDSASNAIAKGRSNAYVTLWKEKFLTSEQDKAALDKWRTIQNKIEDESSSEPIKFPIAPVRLPHGKTVRARLAGLNATSPDDYGSRMSKVVSAKDAQELVGVLKHFEPKFGEWWKSEALVLGKPFQEEMAKVVLGSKVEESVASYVRFYRPEIKDGTVIPFQLMYKPKQRSEGSNGEQVANVAVVEFFAYERPSNRIDIIIHELCHYFFWSGASLNHIRLQNSFLKLSDPVAIPCFNVMNEALATVLGNGMVAEKFMAPESFHKYRDQKRSWYNNFAIDGSAKATFSWLKGYINDGGSLFDGGFAEKYTEAIRKEFGEKAESPQMRLMSANFIVGGDWTRETLDLLNQSIQSTFSSSCMDNDVVTAFRDGTHAFPYMSSVMAVKPKDLKKLKEALMLSEKEDEEIQASIDSANECCFGKRLKNGTVIYLLIASENDQIGRLAKKLGTYEKSLIGVLN